MKDLAPFNLSEVLANRLQKWIPRHPVNAAGCNLRFYNIVEAIPLKQGLKPNVGDNVYLKDDNIVEAIPLKQGLKLKAKVILIIAHAGLLRLFH